jgi:hypothetical protein
MLVRCLYASRFAKAPSPTVLRSILEESRKNNVKHGITGVLISTGDSFIQVLEGGRHQVSQTYNHIAADKRHSDVTLLSFDAISQRSFESWSMGEVSIAQLNPSVLLKHSATMHIDPFAMSGAAVLALLNDLVASGTVICGNSMRGKR